MNLLLTSRAVNRRLFTPTVLRAWLLAMLLLIGVGSFAFHTLATRWAGALDVLFIALYLHFYL